MQVKASDTSASGVAKDLRSNLQIPRLCTTRRRRGNSKAIKVAQRTQHREIDQLILSRKIKKLETKRRAKQA